MQCYATKKWAHGSDCERIFAMKSTAVAAALRETVVRRHPLTLAVALLLRTGRHRHQAGPA